MTQSVNSPSVVHGIDRLAGAVSKWAEESGSQTAVSASDGILSFAELADRTRGLASKLSAHGVGPRVTVGLLLGRSRLGLSSLLAVWSLGATAVLLDERHPEDRFSFVLQDAGVEVLMAGQAPPGAVPSRVRVVDPDVIGLEPVEAVAPQPDDCAYIVYTSGTTGFPKGVEVSYRNLGAFLDALATLDLRPGGMGINAVSPAFDGWLWCTLVYLLHGQGVALVDFASVDGSGDLAELVDTHRPTTVCLTPTLLAALDHIPAADVIMVAGEACPPSLMAQLAGTPRVLNVYGPTEATVASTWADTARGDDPTTIGRPAPGYEIYVLDAQGRPVAAGATGELHIGGPGVSLGYHNRPELTDARFLPDPFVGGDARMYRTGDLVRVRADGQLEFRGRNDEQVKIRGFRVELRELELVALDLDCVRSAAAFVATTGDSLGIAVTTFSGTDPAECVERIRAHAAVLPDYMRPSAVDVVDALPALVTGKVDRAALGLASKAPTGGDTVGTDRERYVCEVWGDVLSRPVRDVDANFFELGGHSLLAARVVGVLRRNTGLPLSVGHLLADPTPAGVAKQLDELATAKEAGG